MTDTTETAETTEQDAVARHLGTRVLPDGDEATVLSISQVYATDLGDLWDAVTNPDRIPRWFLPVTGDLKVGGSYQLEGNAGGEVLACEPPRSFEITWVYGEDVSWVEVELTAAGDGATRFELRHIAKPGPHWDRFGPGAVGIGWDQGLRGLALHLASGEAVDPAAAMAWSMSPEGVAFTKASGEGWYEADVARGTDPADARARADATFAAYTDFPSDDAPSGDAPSDGA